jgi:hypothetical protein
MRRNDFLRAGILFAPLVAAILLLVVLKSTLTETGIDRARTASIER